MSFIWPVMLWSLLLIPLFAALYLRAQQRRRLALSRGSLGLAPGMESDARLRRHLPATLLIAGLGVLLLGLARPQAAVSLPRVEGTVMLAFDVSGSMAADDIEPTRMEAAKAAAREFVQRQPRSVLIGVVAFSDSGFTVQPPTNDQEAILAAIDRLTPERGTSLANGILMSLNTLFVEEAEPRLLSNLTPTPALTPTPVPAGTYTSAAIVLLTDGENTVSPDPLEAALAAANRGVRVYTIGVGSPAGAILQIEGFSVHSRLDEGMLRQISQITGGAYYNAQSEAELRRIYDELEPQWVIKAEEIEITPIFAGAGSLVLLLGGAFSLLWFGRLP